MIEINGIAHICITVNNLEKCKTFYVDLLSFMGLKQAFNGDDHLYFVGGRTAVGIGPSSKEFKHEKYHQNKVGLHHVCFRAKKREDVDQVFDFLKSNGAKIIHPPEEGPWARGYYSVLFEDPDGIHLEVNFVPGKGIFEDGHKFNPADDYK